MSIQCVELANAIVNQLNTQEFSLQFTASRRAVPINDLEQLKSVTVIVLDGSRKSERSTRGAIRPFRYTFKPIVLVQKKLASDSVEAQLVESDELLGLCEEMELSLSTFQPAGCAFIGFDEQSDNELYNFDAMRAYECFSRAIRLEYMEA